MSMRWIMLYVFVFGVMIYLSSTFEKADTIATWGPGGGTIGRTEAPLQILQDAIQGKELFQQQEILGGIVSIPLPNTEAIGALYDILTLRADFLEHDELGKMFNQLVIFPFVAAGVLTLVFKLFSLILSNITFG